MDPILGIPAHIAALPEEEQGPALVEAIQARKMPARWAPTEQMRALIPPFLLEAAQLIADAYGSVRVVRNLESITIDCPKNPGIKPIVYRYGQDLTVDALKHTKYVRNEEVRWTCSEPSENPRALTEGMYAALKQPSPGLEGSFLPRYARKAIQEAVKRNSLSVPADKSQAAAGESAEPDA